MIRRALAAAAAAALLCGCGQRDGAAFSVDQAEALVASGAFEQVLEPVEGDLAAAYLGLTEEPDGAALYTSLDMGYELLAILEMPSEEAAQAAEEAVKAHAAAALEMEREMQYRPEDVSKLENAVIRREGRSVLYAVCADAGALERALKE